MIKFCGFQQLICFAFLLFNGLLNAQDRDSLKLLNGNIIPVKIEAVNENSLIYSQIIRGKIKLQRRDFNTIFSYIMNQQEEVIVYEYDPEIGNIYQREEMKDYMTGERHAEVHYQSAFYNYLGLLGGVGAGYYLAEEGEISMVAFPIIYSSIIIITGAKVKKHGQNEQYFSNGAYIDGYKRVAKGKKFLNALKFSGFSLLGSFAIFSLTTN